MAFINDKKNKVLKIKHSDTPEIIEFEDDLALPSCTYCFLFQKNDCVTL